LTASGHSRHLDRPQECAVLTFLMRVSLVGCSMESSPRLALKQSFFARSVIEFNMNLKTVALRVPVSTADCPSLSSGRRMTRAITSSRSARACSTLLGSMARRAVSGFYKITQLLPSKAMIVNIASRAPMSRMSGWSRKASSSAICDPVAALSVRPAREAR